MSAHSRTEPELHALEVLIGQRASQLMEDVRSRTLHYPAIRELLEQAAEETSRGDILTAASTERQAYVRACHAVVRDTMG